MLNSGKISKNGGGVDKWLCIKILKILTEVICQKLLTVKNYCTPLFTKLRSKTITPLPTYTHPSHQWVHIQILLYKFIYFWPLLKKFSCTREVHVEKRTKHNKIPNEQPGFGCQPAFRSHSQLLTNKLFSLFFIESLSWASRVHDKKGTFLLIFECFRSFSTIRTHAQACLRWSKYTTHQYEQFNLSNFIVDMHARTAQMHERLSALTVQSLYWWCNLFFIAFTGIRSPDPWRR